MSTSVIRMQPASSSTLKRLIVRHPLVAYFVIAFGGTWIFFLPFVLSRGVNGLGLLSYMLPDIALFAVFILGTLAGPALASISVTAATSGKAGVGHLLRRCVQWRVSVGWYVIAIFGLFLIYFVGYSVFLRINLLLALLAHWTLLLTVFLPQTVFIILTGAFAEELGWRGFALPRLQQRYGPVLATIILGTLHGLWHLPAFFTRLLGPFNLIYYVGFLFTAMAATFLFTWIFNHTQGSVLLATLTHGCGDGIQNVIVLLIPANLVVSGWTAPIANGNWNGINVITFGICAILLLIFTRGRLGYHPEQNAQLIMEPQPAEISHAPVEK